MSPIAKATLESIRPSHRCVVRSVTGEGRVRCRLLELGMVPGTEVEIVRLAPLGDPMQVSLRGYQLSLRRSEARKILVDPS